MFDVFLAHNSQDKPQVRAIARYLKQRGLNVWLDEEQMYGGDTPYLEIEKALYNSKTVVFFIGSSGSGRWQGNLELPITVDLVIHSNIRLIPVLLPGIKEIPPEENYRFLRTKLWIEFETIDDTNARKRLYDSICRSVQTEVKQVQTDDLSFKKEVDYTRLRNLLKVGKWEEADKETLAVMLKASGREQEGWLDVESIEKFPCTDLRTIDQLWVKYSNGRFGFSVQKRIWESVGGTPDTYYEILKKTFEKFGDRVGWRVKGNWIIYPVEVIFSTSAPVGHLPLINVIGSRIRLLDGFVWEFGVEFGGRAWEGLETSSLAQRLVECNTP